MNNQPENPMKKVKVLMPKTWIDDLDNLVKAGHFVSRSSAIRQGVQLILDKYRSFQPPPQEPGPT